jgi:hypothetical protein
MAGVLRIGMSRPLRGLIAISLVSLAASLVLGIVSGGWLSTGTTTTAESSPDLLQLALLDDSGTEY